MIWNLWLRYAVLCMAFLPKSTRAVGNFSWVNFSSSVLQRSMDSNNNNRTKEAEDINVYYAIFADRQDVMKIHFQYTDMMLQLGLVTEVHVWDFTNGNTADSDYLSSYMRSSALPGYSLFRKPSSQTERKVKQDQRDKYLWHSFYTHYLNNKRYRPQDILIKADDDIVYIHMSSFKTFIEAVANSTDKSLHFPNIINNDVGFVVQYDRVHGAPELQKWMTYYTVAPHQFDFKQLFHDYYNESYSIKMSTPITSWADGSFNKGDFAQDMHRVFLRNPSRYLYQLHNSDLPRLVQCNQRISINMYAAKFDVIRDIYRLFLEEYCCDNEDFIGAVPTLTHNSHIIHVEFVVSYLAFKEQYRNEQLLSIRSEYANIAAMFTQEYGRLRSTR